MKNVVLLLLFIGILVIVQGYYEGKIKKVKSKKVITKYIPLHVYEGKMSGEEMITNQFKSSYEKITENYKVKE
jgi:hypothetical protein|tara:strand:- start:718 stop:936 length:219 start_codon:yes stop_codon:yes gene_type:complete